MAVPLDVLIYIKPNTLSTVTFWNGTTQIYPEGNGTISGEYIKYNIRTSPTVTLKADGYEDLTIQVVEGDNNYAIMEPIKNYISSVTHKGTTYTIKDAEARQDIATKQDALATQTAYSAKGSSTKVPQITTNNLGQVTNITEVTISQPTVNNKTITIQKNSTTVDSFTLNQSTDKTINISVPTTAADVGAVPTTRTVNGKTLSSDISLTASDVGAISSHQSIKSLKTDNTTTQTASSSEAIAGSGTINLHKVSKTGSYNDLLNKPTIPVITDTYSATSSNGMSGKAVASAISNKADKATTLSGYGITDAYTKTEIDGMVSAGMHFKGTVASYSNLPTTGNKVGDMWNVTDTGANYAWDGTAWDKLSENVDLSGYVPTSRTINNKALTSNINLTASDVGALPDSTTIPQGTVTSVRVQATSPVQSSTSTAQSTTLNTTISLANAYGDTKNPYGTKTANYVLAGPSSGSAAAPSFRALTKADIPLASETAASGGTTTSLVTTGEKYTWNNKQSAISDLATIRSGASAGATAVQPGDLATVATSGSYDDLTDKPTIPAAQVNSDWNATSGVAQILNKPTIPQGTVKSVRVQAGTGLSSSTSTAQTETLNTTISIASGYKLPTTTEWGNKQDALATQTAYTSKGSATKVPQITTNTLGQVTGITEVTISQPTVSNKTITIQKNSTTVDSFTLNQSTDKTVNISVPTTVAELSDSSNYVQTSSLEEAATVAKTGDYNDLINKPTIPTVGNAEIEIQKNSVKVDSFTTNQSGNKKTINITVPTKTSDITNDSGFLTSHQSIKTLKTDNTSAQTASSSETITGSGTISLHKVSKTGSYNDLLNKPTIPTVNNGTLKIQVEGTDKDTFTANQSTNTTINITKNDFARTKTYTGLIATENNQANATFYFMTVRGNTWNDEWCVRYRVLATLDDGATPSNYQYFKGNYECYITGRQGVYTSYANFNSMSSTSYRPIYYQVNHKTTEAGYNAGYGTKLGVDLTSSNSNLDTNYKRTIKIILLDAINCEVTFNDAPEIPPNSTRTDYTKLNSSYYTTSDSNSAGNWTRLNACDNGLQETGDVNTTYGYLVNTIYTGNTKIDANGYGARYSLVFPTTSLNTIDERWSSLVTSSGTGTSKAAFTDLLFYIDRHPQYVYSANIAAGAASANSLYQDFTNTDIRYTVNTNNTYMSATKKAFLYLKDFNPTNMTFKSDATIGNIFTLDKIATRFPSSTSGDVYIYFLGWTTNSWYAVTPAFTQVHKIFKYTPSTGVMTELIRDEFNKKQDKLTSQTAYSGKGTATKVPQITTNALGQVTSITEVDITHPTELPSQTGQSGKYLTTNGTAVSWGTIAAPSIKTLKTNNTTAQSTSSSEAIAGSGTINLHKVSKTGSYSDLLNKPTIPTVNNASLVIQKNSSDVATFTANASTNVTCNITVPTTVAELSDSSNYIQTSELVELATVAETGSYNDLTDKPAIPQGTVTSVRVQATSPVQSSTSTEQSSTLNTTISLADGYGDTKNPYASKTKNYVLAAPSTANGAPTFRALTKADIPLASETAASGGTTTSLVTTGEKYTWNNKQNALTAQTAYTSKGSATKVPQITTNTLGQVTGITEVDITHPTELPSQTGQSGKFLTTNGSTVSWAATSTNIDNSTITKNGSNQIQTVGYKDVRTSNTLKTWTGTRAQYDAIATKDANTLYNITDDTDTTLAMLELLYPVGAVYIGTMDVCPLATLGIGSWEKIAEDQVLQGSSVNHSAGDIVEAGLPNIIGKADNFRSGNGADTTFSGALTYTYTTEWPSSNSKVTDRTYYSGIKFDASHSNSIYGNSSTVQPPAFVVNIWRRIS